MTLNDASVAAQPPSAMFHAAGIATARSAIGDVLREIVLPKFERVRMSGGSYAVHCPAHHDNSPSLSISPGTTQPVIFKCHAGCDTRDILAALDLTWNDLCNPQPPSKRPGGRDDYIICGRTGGGYDTRHRKVADYEYRNPSGVLIFGVARCSLKGQGCGFRQWRPDPTKRSGRTWSRTLPDGQRAGEGLIYRLPEVLGSSSTRNVWIVEGEKDADRLWTLGIPATCNAQGAGKWTLAHADWLAGRDVVICADRDDPGWRHAEHVANTLLNLARSIEVVRAAVGKDISDHLDARLALSKTVSVAEPKGPPPLDAEGRDVLGVTR